MLAPPRLLSHSGHKAIDKMPASLLHTGSQTSVSTATSLADSLAVNAPVTCSTSPGALSTSPPKLDQRLRQWRCDGRCRSQRAAHSREGGEACTGDSVMDKPVKRAKGFMNIPSLDANTTHYPRARTLSVDGTAVPPEAEPIEDPQTPGVMTKPAEHPLQHHGAFPLSFPFFYKNTSKKRRSRLMYLYTGRYITTPRQRCPSRP